MFFTEKGACFQNAQVVSLHGGFVRMRDDVGAVLFVDAETILRACAVIEAERAERSEYHTRRSAGDGVIAVATVEWDEPAL